MRGPVCTEKKPTNRSPHVTKNGSQFGTFQSKCGLSISSIRIEQWECTMEFIAEQVIHLGQEANEKEERSRFPERGRHQSLIVPLESIFPVTR